MTTTNRALYLLAAAAFAGTAPAAVLVVMSWSLRALPIAIATGAIGLLWGLNFLRAAIPARAVAREVTARVKAASDQVSTTACIAAPDVVVSSRAVNASVGWCGERGRMTFPALWATTLTDEQLRAYVAHELAHLTQPAIRVLNRSSQIVSFAMTATISLGLVSLLRPGGITDHGGAVLIYALAPVSLTLALGARRLRYHRTAVALEMAADEQAVAWGASPQVLAETLDRLREPALEVEQPIDQRVLRALLLHDLGANFDGRTTALRAQAA